MGSQDLQQARYDQFVRRVGALYGGGSKVTEVLAELFPVLDMENAPLELMVLSGWRKAFIFVSRTAAVGELVAANLFNPADSGQVAVVERIEWMVAGTADNVDITILQNTLTGGQTKGLFRDSRLGGDRLSTLFATTESNVGTAATFRRFSAANVVNNLDERDGLFVLSPGNAVQVGYSSVTAGFLGVAFFWRERTAEQSELNF